VVLLPGMPLVSVLVLTQVLNALLLLPLLVLMHRLSRDPEVMGALVASRVGAAVRLTAIGFIAVCVAALLVLTVA
jgi:Mn2+/Fe2+ NRAMP family transporter